MKIYDLVTNIFVRACPATYHDVAEKEPEEYLVWTVEGKRTFRADGMQDEAAGQITVDIYTKKEFSEVPERLEMLMDASDEVAYTDPAVGYDIKTGYTHYVYTVEVV